MTLAGYQTGANGTGLRWGQDTASRARLDRKPVASNLTRDSALEFLGKVTVAPVTSTVRAIPSEVILSTDDGFRRDCAVNLDHIQTVSKGKIGSLITRLNDPKMERLREALLFALGFAPR
ncbi:MAG: type II toxin-antitoxin system PemK/MazF family toxin [Acidobacteriota bacterium]